MKLNSVRFSSVKNQILAVSVANFGTLCYGQLYGWQSPSLERLQSVEDTPLLLGPVTANQIAWLTACQLFGCILGQWSSAILASKFGLKWTINILQFPCLLGWILVIFGNKIESLYISRLFCGIIGGSQFYSIPLYVAEISDPIIRGRLGTLLIVTQCFGIIMVYVVASYVNYYIVPYIFLPFSIIFQISFAFIPHTSQYLVAGGKIQEAQKSIRFYKNLYDDTSETEQNIQTEIENVKKYLSDRLTAEKIKLSDFLTPEARYAVTTAIILLFVYLGTGNVIFVSFAASIFRDSGSNLDPNISAIIIAIVQFCGVLLATISVDKIGRRALMIVSTLLSTIGLLSMGIFNYLSVLGYEVNVVNWIPVISLAVSLLSGSAGVVPVSYIILAEIFPPKIRRISSLMFLVILTALFGIVAPLFPIIVELGGLYMCFLLLAIFSSFGFFFSIFRLKETTGKNIN